MANTDNMGKLLVMVFAAPCSHDKSCQNLHPDTRTYPQYKSCNVTDFWLRDSLYRDTAQVPLKNILYRDSIPASIKLVPRHARLRQNLYLDGKNHSIPSLHRDSFVAKVPGLCPDASSGNTTSPYCRAVRRNELGDR